MVDKKRLDVRCFKTYGAAMNHLCEEVSLSGSDPEDIQIMIADVENEVELVEYIFFVAVNEKTEKVVQDTSLAKVSRSNLTRDDLGKIEEMGVYGEGMDYWDVIPNNVHKLERQLQSQDDPTAPRKHKAN